MLLAVVLTAQLMVVLDATIVNVALPHIQEGLGFSGGQLSWVLNAYILTFGGFLLLGARAGDLLGRRTTFLAGIAVFTLSSLWGGLAVTGWMLLAARAVQGLGAAFAAPSALALLTAAFPEGQPRTRAIALYTTMSAVGGATGLVVGGLLTEFASWRWVMFVNVPIGVAVLCLGLLALPQTSRRHGRFDVGGAVTSTLGMAGVVLGLVNGGSAGWAAPSTYVPILVGAALLAVFVGLEQRAEEPILPLGLVRNRVRSSANATRGLLYAAMFGTFFFLGQFLQDVQGYSPVQAGVAFLPLPLSVFLSSQLTSRVLLRRWPQRTVMLAGVVVVTLGVALLTTLGAETGYAELLVSLVLLGAGMGVAFVTLTTASLHEVRPEESGAAAGLINVSQQLGGALGLAVLVNVFQNSAPAAGLASAAGAGASTRMVGGLVSSLDAVFLAAFTFAVAALGLVAFAMRSRPVPAAEPQPARAEERPLPGRRSADGFEPATREAA
jgi:EmrB/QacA subfamily drug resistance transporter